MIPRAPHHSEAEAVHIAAAQRMTAAQKIAVLHSLRQTAWDLKAAWLRRRHPGLSEDEVQGQVRQSFLRAIT